MPERERDLAGRARRSRGSRRTRPRRSARGPPRRGSSGTTELSVQPQRDGLREPARRVGGTEQQIGDRTTGGLTRQPALQHRRRVVHPVGHSDRRAVGQHDHQARVRGGEPRRAGRAGRRAGRCACGRSLPTRRAAGSPRNATTTSAPAASRHGLDRPARRRRRSGSMVKPGAKTTSTPSGTPARSSSRATSTRVGLTWELPAPW